MADVEEDEDAGVGVDVADGKASEDNELSMTISRRSAAAREPTWLRC